MAKTAKKNVQDFTFGKENMYGLAAGIIGIVIGFILMAQPPVDGFLSRTLAPIVLVISYLVIIPLAIMRGKKKQK
ncbi:MAG: hypothetical protein D6677_06025 [Calditrichaeota bacterium]|nr:MAG: hypothetical protein D6677_06025 [Calditrichota bacterium]